MFCCVHCMRICQNEEFCLAIFWSAPEDGDLVAVLQLGQHRPQLLVLLLRDVHRQVHYGLVDALWEVKGLKKTSSIFNFLCSKIFPRPVQCESFQRSPPTSFESQAPQSRGQSPSFGNSKFIRDNKIRPYLRAVASTNSSRKEKDY